jgi:hypothetical protein
VKAGESLPGREIIKQQEKDISPMTDRRKGREL